MTTNFIKYIITTPIFLLIDLVWLNLTSSTIYKKQIGHLLAEKPNLVAGLVFYLIFTVGLIIFAINPALENNSVKTALSYGALFGFFTYATYDFTNYATLKNWPLNVLMIDILWGTFVCAVVSAISFLIIRKVI